MSYQIEFEPAGRRGECPEGKSLLECAHFLGVGMVSICGGFGKCKSCRVRVLKGTVSGPNSIESEYFSAAQLKDGWRLACLTYPRSDCVLHVPQESLTSLQRMQVESRNITAAIEPSVVTYRIEMNGPTFNDLRSDSTRVLAALAQDHKTYCNSVDIDVLRDISNNLRSANWKVTAAVRGDEIIALLPQDTRQLGVAVDVGTTKIAGYLLDLVNGRTLAARGIMNPQINYGEDITTRIHRAFKSSSEALVLQQTVVSGLNKLVEELCFEAGAKATDILDACIVGNTAIHHLLLKLPVYSLTHPPFCAAVQESLDIKARDIGWQLAPGAYTHILPNIAGFVGADHVSMLLAIDALTIDKPSLAIDIGTNTEIALINKDSIYSVSCASGPVFEGGHISCGMRAANGAIERLRIENSQVQYQTIDNSIPVGICGSGIIDAIAQMYQAGVLDESGRMQEGHSGVRSVRGDREFILFEGKEGSPAVTVSQRDVREVQLGKSAIRAGIQVLLETAGYDEVDVEQVIIAGAFGTYIDIGNAISLGMLPVLPLKRFQQVGNAAGLGARLSLLSSSQREKEKIIAKRIHYIELSSAPTFNNNFIQSQYLGQYRIKNGKREKIGL